MTIGTEQETLLLVKRTGLDKTWQVAPYPVKSREGAECLATWLKTVWSVPFEYKVIP